MDFASALENCLIAQQFLIERTHNDALGLLMGYSVILGLVI
jgi:hypothetical protein